MESSTQPVRYAVVGLGHIAQNAVLPAFANAQQNSRLVALISDDAEKLAELSKRYKVPHRYSYQDYDACLANPEIDAVFIALPNHMHAEYSVRAMEAGKHVLCEKPMAVTTAECQKMIHAANTADVRLMIAYRLHFEEANLKAIEIAQSGQLGELRYFTSTFSMQVRAGDIRLRRETGGGAIYDIGIYCINAARYLFRAAPEEVLAVSLSSADPRFVEVDETTSVILRFPGNRLASFTSSFNAGHTSEYRIVGTQGDLRLEPAYGYQTKLVHHLTVDGKTTKTVFAKRDQFAPELIYFSDCVRQGKTPEPSAEEGLNDVQVIEAIYQSAQEGRPIRLPAPAPDAAPDLDQEIHAPAVSPPELVNTQSPSK